MNKTKETMIKKFGSEKAYKEYMRTIASKAGKSTSGYPFAHGKVNPSVAGRFGGKMKKLNKEKVY